MTWPDTAHLAASRYSPPDSSNRFVFLHYAATVLPPRRKGRVKAEQELLTLACLCGFRLEINSGLVMNTADFFLEMEESAAEERSGGCFEGGRGGRPWKGGAAGTTGQSEITGLSIYLGSNLQAEEFAPPLHNKIRAPIKRAKWGFTGILSNKHELRSPESRGNSSRRRMLNMMGRRNWKTSDDSLHLAEELRTWQFRSI